MTVFKKNAARRLAVILATLIIPLMLSLFYPAAAGPEAAEESDMFALLRQQLIKDGFDAGRVNTYYDSRQVRFEVDTVSRYFHHSEARINYGQFLTPASLESARDYMKKHDHWLKKAEQEYRVEKEIIAAILLVETRFGRVLGEAVTFNVLSSMAVLADPVRRRAFWESIAPKANLNDQAYQEKAVGKSGWAYRELKAFLHYVDRENISAPLAITGSYAGAIGIPQFMPSNVLNLAVDGDKDGKVDLFTHADAIVSVARYLNHHGWKPDLPEADESRARQVLRRYNNSRFYVDALLTIRRELR